MSVSISREFDGAASRGFQPEFQPKDKRESVCCVFLHIDTDSLSCELLVHHLRLKYCGHQRDNDVSISLVCSELSHRHQ